MNRDTISVECDAGSHSACAYEDCVCECHAEDRIENKGRNGIRMKGEVVFFSAAKGWGFISRNDGEKDVFVYHDSIIMEGYRTLKPGQQVEFEMGDGPQGTQACNVRVVE